MHQPNDKCSTGHGMTTLISSEVPLLAGELLLNDDTIKRAFKLNFLSELALNY